MSNQSHSIRYQSPKWRKLLYVIIICALASIPAQPVLADVAPPKAVPGANPSPDGEVTQVRMVDEIVIIEVQEETDFSQMGTARVWAEFQMMNQGDESEVLMVRFPTSSSDGFSNYPEIQDLLVYVNNQSVRTSRYNLEGEPDNWYDPVQWAEFEAEFPPGEMVEIEVVYTLLGTGEYPFVSYSYLLETGAGWKGTIGSAQIIVKLPYPATTQTVFVDSSPGWGQTTTEVQLEGNQVSWHYENLEPSSENNISISMVWPSTWHKMELERQIVTVNPQDGEAWGRLAKVYKDLAFLRKWMREDPGGEELFSLSVEAYENCLELLPEDALWHAGLGDLLFWKYKDNFFNGKEETRDGFVRALKEIYIAYTLNPDHSFINDYLKYYFPKEAVEIVGDEVIFHWLTSTPTLSSPIVEFSVTEAPPTEVPPSFVTETLPPMPSGTPTPQEYVEDEREPSREKSPLPICGSLIMIPFFLVIPILKGKKSRK